MLSSNSSKKSERNNLTIIMLDKKKPRIHSFIFGRIVGLIKTLRLCLTFNILLISYGYDRWFFEIPGTGEQNLKLISEIFWSNCDRNRKAHSMHANVASFKRITIHSSTQTKLVVLYSCCRSRRENFWKGIESDIYSVRKCWALSKHQMLSQ